MSGGAADGAEPVLEPVPGLLPDLAALGDLPVGEQGTLEGPRDLAAGGGVRLARRWRRPAPAAAAGPELDPDDARRLDAELTAFDR